MSTHTMSSHVSEPRPHHQRTVLVVEDDQVTRQLLTEYLEREGAYDVLTAANVQDALRKISHVRVDAIVVDLWRQPGPSEPDDLEIILCLRAEPAFMEIPILVLTGVVLTPAEEEIIRAGQAYVFYKPDGLSILVEYLEKLVGFSRWRGAGAE